MSDRAGREGWKVSQRKIRKPVSSGTRAGLPWGRVYKHTEGEGRGRGAEGEDQPKRTRGVGAVPVVATAFLQAAGAGGRGVSRQNAGALPLP